MGGRAKVGGAKHEGSSRGVGGAKGGGHMHTNHVSGYLVAGIQFLEIFLWPLLVRISTQKGSYQVVDNVISADALNLVTALDWDFRST